MFDYEDLRKRLHVAGFDETHPIAVSVLNLAVTLDNEQLSHKDRELVFNLFSIYGIEQLKSIPSDILELTVWQDFDYGNTKIGDFVRVKQNAYDAKTAMRHNGKLGILISMHAMRCKVKYIGDRSTSNMVHPMSNLESINRVYNR